MANLNADFAHMFGSDNDTVYLGLRTPTLATALEDLDSLSAQIPTGLEDVGWLSEDGIEMSFDDSTEDLRGFQGNGVVKSYMSESSTSFTAALLESKLQTVLNYLDAEPAETTSAGETRIKAKASRTAKAMCGVIDLYDTSNTDVRFRYVFPHLTLGEREAMAFKNGEITAYNHTLKVLGNYYVLTNAEGMKA